MNINFAVLHKLIFTPVLVLFVIFLFYKLVKRNFRTLHCGALFLLFAFSILGCYYLNLFAPLNFFPIPQNIYSLSQKLLIFLTVFSAGLVILKISDEIIFNAYLRNKANIHVPTLFRDIIMFTVMAIIILATLRIEFGLKLTGILTSSAIVSVIIGFALQDTLANIIAGIVIHIEKPFELRDWIKIGDREGEIVETSWRATRLRTIDGNYIIIPNTTISKDIIVNYYKPTKTHALVFNIGIEYDASPTQTKEVILKTINDCNHILKNPIPSIFVTDFGDNAIQYQIKIWIENHAIYKNIQDEVMTKLWYNLKRNNIQVPFPIRTVYFHQEQTRKDSNNPEILDIKKSLIKKIGLFQDLPENDIAQMAELSKIKSFTKGEKIITQNEESYSLYLITAGQASIFSQDIMGNIVPLKNLTRGEYFGEMSLLTGEKRSATVLAQNEITLLEIEASSILPILQRNPNLMESLSNKLAERKLNTKDLLDKAALNEKNLEKENLSKNIFHKIKDFFSINPVKKRFALLGSILF